MAEEKPKKAKRVFDLTLLNECIMRDGAALVGEYDKLRWGTMIKFKCKCGSETEKKFSNIADKSGAVCNISCPESNNPRIIYNNTLLNTISERDNSKIIGDYPNISINSKITYICKCGNECTKPFRNIVNRTGLICKICTDILQKEKTKETFMEKYGVPNPQNNKEIKEKTKKTNLLKYGTEYTFKSEKVKDKIKATNLIKYGDTCARRNKDVIKKAKNTCLLKYGVENTMQSEEVKAKVRKTNLQNWGVECSLNSKEVQDKIKKAMLEKFGVEHNFQAGELRDNRKITFLAKYGVEYPSQNVEVMEKAQRNALKYKPYKFPSGEIRNVQGYEPLALDELVKVYSEEQLKTDRKDVPHVEYTIGNKKHFYFPDIWIPHENKLIEVKSTWTMKKKSEITMAKANSCRDKGYCFEIWVYDGKGGKNIILPDVILQL